MGRGPFVDGLRAGPGRLRLERSLTRHRVGRPGLTSPWTGLLQLPGTADVAQLVEHNLAKVGVAGSNPVVRSKVQYASTPAVEWPSGEATACKAVHTGSIPVSTSEYVSARLAQRESASLTRKRSLVQSQYRAPQFPSSRSGFLPGLLLFLIGDRSVALSVQSALRAADDCADSLL